MSVQPKTTNTVHPSSDELARGSYSIYAESIHPNTIGVKQEASLLFARALNSKKSICVQP